MTIKGKNANDWYCWLRGIFMVPNGMKRNNLILTFCPNTKSFFTLEAVCDSGNKLHLLGFVIKAILLNCVSFTVIINMTEIGWGGN